MSDQGGAGDFPGKQAPQPDGPREQAASNPTPNANDVPAAAIVRVLEICNKKGLHARASAKFVQTVERFEADVRVARGPETVGGTSIMGLMMLAAGPGTSITVTASGPEANQVIEALAELVAARFAEDE
ncbi:MAG TPA: HPr family phosphocarrier protein [Xanthobacteraceae bacterium]|jgi:phosphocarrier protein|nr:HPr family phosphocarrier protein [Xanthobacteraceae bacterium]